MNFRIEPLGLTISLTAIVVALIGAVWALVKHYAQKQVDHEFNKRIETHKNELQSIINYNNFNFGRRLQEFNLFITKKHEIYPRLFELYLIADGRISGLRGFSSGPDYLSLSSKQIEYLLEVNFELPKVTFEDRIENWDINKEQLLPELILFIERLERQRAHKALLEAKNHTLIWDIYLSEEVSRNLMELSTIFHTYLFDLQSLQEIGVYERMELRQEVERKRERIDELIPKIKELMQQELSRGDKYEKEP